MRSSIPLVSCRKYVPEFSECVEAVASRLSLPSRQLAVRTLLQIPRIATPKGEVSISALNAEIEHAACTLARDLLDFQSSEGWWESDALVADLTFGPLAHDTAKHIFNYLHYLKSFREDSEAFALFTPDAHKPLAVCTVSPLQWNALGSLLERTTGASQTTMFDVSRVYAFDSAPKNSISMLLSKVRKVIRYGHPDASLLSTVVDQNLGFTGKSYLAANWQRWARIEPRPYLYIDGAYKTIRQIQEMYGDERWESLAADSSLNFEMSKVALLDSLVFIQPLRPGSVKALKHQGYTVQREN